MLAAPQDTYRGRVCECPAVDGVQYKGDGYKECKPVGPGRCAANNDGCWKEMRHDRTFSACKGFASLSGCECPPGFRGDGLTCQDMDECSEKVACTCLSFSCRNPWGGYHCGCGDGDNQVYVMAKDTCVGKSATVTVWLVTALVLSCLVGVGLTDFAFYK